MSAPTLALFRDRHSAHAAVEQLVQAGFARDSISVLMSEETHERQFSPPPPPVEPGPRSDGLSTPLPRPAGVLASIVAGLVGLSGGAGPSLRAGGPLAAQLTRARDGGGHALPDALAPLVSSLSAAGWDATQARFVDEGVRGGAIVVGVHAAGDRSRLVTQLLALSGGSALEAA